MSVMPLQKSLSGSFHFPKVSYSNRSIHPDWAFTKHCKLEYDFENSKERKISVHLGLLILLYSKHLICSNSPEIIQNKRTNVYVQKAAKYRTETEI